MPESALVWEERPTLRRPVLIAAFEGWADAADAASLALSHLVETWGGRRFAHIDAEEFFDFTSTRPRVRLDDGLERHVDWPGNVFYAGMNTGAVHDVVLLDGTEPHLKWKTFTDLVMQVVDSLGVELVLTLGALLTDVPHTRPVRMTMTSAHPAMLAREGFIRSRYQGPTGILSVIHDALGRRGVPSGSYWAAVPHYVAQIPSPKAAMAHVQAVAQHIGAEVRLGELEVASTAYERRVDEAVSRDDDIVDYVRRLEAAADRPQLIAEPPSAEELAAEVERFLRDQPRD